jgi:hypothetical protein
LVILLPEGLIAVGVIERAEQHELLPTDAVAEKAVDMGARIGIEACIYRTRRNIREWPRNDVDRTRQSRSTVEERLSPSITSM